MRTAMAIVITSAVRTRARALSALILVATLFGPSGCRERQTTRSSASAGPPATAAPSASSALAKRAVNEDRPEPLRLIALAQSAYHASIAADVDAAYLLATQAAYRLTPGQPPEEQKIELGFGATATRHSFVFWSNGALLEAEKSGGGTRRLVELGLQPQLLVSSGAEIGWVERSGAGRFSIGSLSGERATTAYISPGKIEPAAMLNDWIFFVERPTDKEWRIGGVRTKGGAPVFTSLRGGRAPSMLVGERELHYYDGNRREVRRLSPDLRDEKTVVTDFICSPLAVAERVFCANVEGLFELVPGARPRLLARLGNTGAVTALAANSTHLYWIGDAGADQLVVSAVALPASH